MIVVLVFFPGVLFGQISVTGNLTAQQLAEVFAGSNITVSNAVLNGSPVASGSFTSTGFNFASGVILSTGTLDNCVGPNDDPNTSDNLGYPGDAEMEALGGSNSWDAISLEFDFIVQSSSVQFEYIFGSEDYPEAAPPNQPSFNDVFAFYISGPGIVGSENIARIPGTVDPVTIDNVNPVTNSQYYVDNNGGQEIQFDGYTVPLVAFKNGLTPCETYHLKLIISDIHNTNRNSAVFLKENSFVQENVLGVEAQTVNSDGVALEGCIDASFTFEFDQVSNQDRVINFQVGGSAVNGVDYAFVDTSITIPAGDLQGTVTVDAFSDGITEGQEYIELIYPSGGCVGGFDTVLLFINDAQPIDFTLTGTDLNCFGNNSGEILVNASGGFPAYTYVITHPDGTVTETENNPVTGLTAGQYSVQVYDTYGCQAEALVVGGVFDAGTTFLPDGQGVTYQAPLLISGFGTGETITNVSQIQQICLTMEHSYLGDLEISVESPSGQIVVLKQQDGGNSCDLGEPFASGQVDGANSHLADPGVGYEYCFNASPIFGTMVQESWNFIHTIPSSTGGTYTDNYLPAGSYTSFENLSSLVGSTLNGTWTVNVNDQFGLDNGYIFNWYISLVGDAPDTSITILEPTEIVVTGFVQNANCSNFDGSVNTSVTGGTGPYTYFWSTGATTPSLTNVPAGTYALTVTDAIGCTSTETFVVNNIGTLSLTSQVTTPSCSGGTDGAIDVTPSGGTPNFSYSWSTGAVTEDVSGLAAGDYTVTITDAVGCTFSEVITVNNTVPIAITNTLLQDEQCSTDNGAISVSASGGSESYGFSWSTGQTTQAITNLTSGTYVIDVMDANGCMASESYTIVNNVSNCGAFCYTTIQGATTNETCGADNGSIDITVLNAVAPVTYSWSNGAMVEDLSGLSAGTYTVTVTDANFCSETMSFTIVNDAGDLSVSLATVVDENCGNGNGSIDISASGGNLPYSFSWSNGGSAEDISSLSAGDYMVTLTDGNGCSVSEIYTVANDPGSLGISASVSDETCTSGNGIIDVTPSGGNGTLTYSWSNGATTQDLSFLSSGNYMVTVTDGTGCSLQETYTVGQSSGNISLLGSNVTNEACGNGQGAINITLTGNNLSFLWSNGATTEDISGLSAGQYTCQVSNEQGCMYTTAPITVVNTSGTLAISAQLVADETCGQSNGSINLSVSGGLTPHTFSWSNGATSEDIVNLSAGTYTVTVTDANGCVEVQSEQIDNLPGTLAIQNAIISDEICGDATGAIDLIPSGGAIPLTYQWSNGEITEDVFGLNSGMYTVTITDNVGCAVSNTYFVTNQTNGLTASSQLTNEVCTNGMGQIDVTPSGGQGPYTFIWSNGATTEDLTGLSSGSYSCVITDDNNCSIHAGPYDIGNTPTNLAAVAVVTNASCGNNGAIDLTITGGAGSPTFSWSDGAITEDISGLAAGSYTYTVTDNNNCVVSGTETVIETNGSMSYTFSMTSEICGDAAGAIHVEVSGGATPHTYLWSNGATTQGITGLSAGLYSCIITDNNGCTITTQDIQVTDLPGNLSITDMVVSDALCTNALGAIDLSTSGGSGTLTYAWSNGETTEDINSLSAGTYSVTVTDASGCQASSSAVVFSNPGTLQISFGIVTDESCSNAQGEIDLTVIGAEIPVVYTWSNGASTQDISNLSAGSYSVSIVDNSGCVVMGDYTVHNTGSSLQIGGASVVNEFCGSGSGSIGISVSGGTQPYSYNWLHGANTQSVSGLSAGNYSITVTDVNGCSTVETYTVQNNPGNLSLNGVITDESCGDGSGAIDVTTSGGNQPLAFNWSTGETTEDLSSLSAGTYDLIVTDNFGCQANYSETVANIAGGLTIVVDAATNENCGQSDGVINTTVTGAVSLFWSNGATTDDISGLSAGTYTLTAIDNLGCQVSETVTIVNNTGSLAITFENIGDENCQNGQGFVDIEVIGTGPFTYVWSDGQTTQDAINLASGMHTVTITDGVGCELQASYTVNNANSTNLAGSAIITDALCSLSNGTIDLTVSGGISPYTFSWNSGGNAEDPTNLAAGTYEVTITDALNCTVTETYTVNQQSSSLAIDQIFVGNEFCGQSDGLIFVEASGTGVDFFLDGVYSVTNFFDFLAAGSYLVTVTDAYGCSLNSTVLVNNDALFTVSHVQVNETCGQADGAIDLTVSSEFPGSNYTYSWSNGATTEDISGLSVGTYTVTVTDDNWFCTADYSVTIVNDSSSSIAITGAITDDHCGVGQGAIDQTVVSGSGLTYNWSNGATTQDISGLNAGTYTCTVTASGIGGCSETFTYTVGGQTNVMALSFSTTHEVCGDSQGAIDLTVTDGSGSYDYSWDNGQTTEDISGITEGYYTVTVVDQGDNCAISQLVTVQNLETNFGGVTAAIVGATCSTCLDGSIDVTVESGGTYSFNWDSGHTTEDIANLNPGDYELTITSSEDCDTSMVFTVNNTLDISGISVETITMTVHPNPSSGEFTVSYSIPLHTDARLYITDALGKKVTESTELKETGSYKENASRFEAGMYFVVIETNTAVCMERLVVTQMK